MRSENVYKLLVYLRKHEIRTKISKKRRNPVRRNVQSGPRRMIKGKKKRSNRINDLENEIEYIRKRILAVQSERNTLAMDLANITTNLKSIKQS